jgi:hypothetical protein
MPLAANTANVQILVDDSKRVLAKLILHQDTAGDESDVLKVNVATLANRTLILNSNNAAIAGRSFLVGEKITGNTSGAVGYVLTHDPVAQKIRIVVDSGTFSGTEVVNGAGGFFETLLSITTPTYLLDIDEVWYSVTGTAKVELAFDDNGTKKPFLHLAGTGTYSRNTFSTKIPNNSAVPNGNLYVSTYGVGAKGGYCLLVELRKQAGFAPRPVY